MFIFTLPDNSIIGPFITLEPVGDGNYLADESLLYANQVENGVISEVADDYLTPEQQANLNQQYNAKQKQNRYDSYTKESDPIFFKSQRGEATQQDWLDKIAEIDARYPYKV